VGTVVVLLAMWGPERAESSTVKPVTTASEKTQPNRMTGEADRVVERGSRRSAWERCCSAPVSATRQRDIDAQLECYGPMVDTFFLKHKLDQAKLRREKQTQFANVSTVRTFDLKNVQVKQINPDLAVVTFTKTWDFVRTAGSERGQMVVRQIGGTWKITSERSLQVYRNR